MSETQIDSVVDLYGFPIKIHPGQQTERATCDQNAVKQQNFWMPFVEKEKLPSSDGKIKELIRLGVPPTLRAWVWMEYSGASKKKASYAVNYYQIMVKASENSPYSEEINQDVPRTFPEHPWLSCPDGHDAMKRVLRAYSVHNDKVGYCRAMNNIVGLLLATLNRNEEMSFWLLAALVEDIIYPGTYARNLEGCQVEMKALDELVATKLPKLHAHFRSIDFDISMLATDWYLCLFSTSLPSETATRVWDSLFNEGPKILFRVALALLKIYEENILRVDNAGELMMRMRNAAATMHHRDVLMYTAFEEIGSLSMSTIEKFREQKQREVEAILHSRGVQRTALPVEPEKKPKHGFGAFMSGMSKLADKTAEQFSKLATKDAPTEHVSAPRQQQATSQPTSPVSPAVAGHAAAAAAAVPAPSTSSQPATAESPRPAVAPQPVAAATAVTVAPPTREHDGDDSDEEEPRPPAQRPPAPAAGPVVTSAAWSEAPAPLNLPTEPASFTPLRRVSNDNEGNPFA